MSPDQERRLEETFSGARDLPPLERAAFLEQACWGDAELRNRHIAAHQISNSALRVDPARNLPFACRLCVCSSRQRGQTTVWFGFHTFLPALGLGARPTLAAWAGLWGGLRVWKPATRRTWNSALPGCISVSGD